MDSVHAVVVTTRQKRTKKATKRTQTNKGVSYSHKGYKFWRVTFCESQSSQRGTGRNVGLCWISKLSTGNTKNNHKSTGTQWSEVGSLPTTVTMV